MVGTDTHAYAIFVHDNVFFAKLTPGTSHCLRYTANYATDTHIHRHGTHAHTQQTHTLLPLTEPMHATICHIYPGVDLILEAGSSVRLPAKCLIHEPKCSRSSRFCVSCSISTCINHVIICIFIVKQWKDQKLLPVRTTVHIFIPTMFEIILISDSVWASH